MSLSAGTAYIDVVPDMQKFGTSVTSQSKSAFSKLGSLAKLAIGGVVAKKVFDFGADAVHAAEEAQAANTKSLKIISADADAAKIHFDALTGWAETFGDSIGQDDEAITTLASKITASFDLKKLGLDNSKGLEGLTKNIINFSEGTGKAQTASIKLYQTIANTPASALTTLTKLGVISQKQADHYKKMTEHGKNAAVSQALLTATQKKYAGVAAAAATPSEKLSAIWDNFKETIGSFLLPLMTKLFGLIGDGIKWVQGLLNGTGKLSGGFKDFYNQIKPFIGLLADQLQPIWDQLVTTFQQDLLPALKQLWTALKPVAMVIGGILYLAILGLLKVLPILIKIVGKAISIYIKFYSVLYTVIAAVVRFAIMIVSKIVTAVTTVIHAGEKIYDFFHHLPSRLAAAGAKMWDWMVDGAKAAINAVIGVINDGIGFINSFQIHIHVDPPGPGNINFDWNGPGIPTIPTLAKGGIVTRPTLAIIGESGPEAVVPLGRSGGLAGARIQIIDSNLGVVMTGVVMDELDRYDSYNNRLRKMA